VESESPWGGLLLVVAVLALVRLPLFRFLDATAATGARFAGIDGLRGFLAFSVFVFHLAITHTYVTTGAWSGPLTPLYRLLGPGAVSLFFMITGFLFWTRLLGARRPVDFRGLYLGRLFRIAPLYLFAVLVMLVIVGFLTGFTLQVPASDVVLAIIGWLPLGFINLQPDVNGHPATHVLAGVTWTLTYEWAFYASLLVTAWFARRAPMAFAAGALALCLAGKALLHSDSLGFASLFLCGMTVASLLESGIVPRWSLHVRSSLAVACLVVPFLAVLSGLVQSGYATPVALALAGFFYFVCSGATLFGLLTTRAAQRLGHISYSLYLLQGLVLTVVFAPAPLARWALSSPLHFWLTGLLCACLLVAFAGITYEFIELPGIRLGRRVAGSRPRAFSLSSAGASAVLASAAETE
jgi:peptidoglycan/LPS O-acetylase OafA/YrhL